MEEICKNCKDFKFDHEYGQCGMCQNEGVMSKLIFGHCDSFVIDETFGCKWFEPEKK